MIRTRTSILSAAIVASMSLTTYGEPKTPDHQQVVVALAEIEKEGGTIDIEKSDGKEISSLAAPSEKVKDKEIKALRFHDLRKLQAALTETAKLNNVRRLEINFCWTFLPRTLSTEELDRIASIESLEELVLSDTTVDSKELKRLKSMPNLTTVRIREIMTRGTFTDAHLAGLAKLESIKSVDVTGAKGISTEAIAAFQKNRPECSVTSAPKPAKN